jgi:hypothetical protein
MTTLTRSRTPRRITATGGTVLAALAVWVIAVPLIGVDLVVPAAGSTVGPLAVVGTTLLAALLGWALLAVLERRTARARRIWTITAGAIALLSLTGPLTSGASPAVTATLVAMHVAVAAVLIPTLPRGVR